MRSVGLTHFPSAQTEHYGMELSTSSHMQLGFR